MMSEDVRKQYNMWTCPQWERKPAYADIKITPELIAKLDDVPAPDRKRVEELTKAFNVPITSKTLEVWVN